jgi:hypothetical protein
LLDPSKWAGDAEIDRNYGWPNCHTGRADQQKTRFVERLKSVAQEFGRQLAVAKSEIAVYTSHVDSMERYVVEGYLEKGGAGDNSIHVLFGGRNAEIDFPRKEEYKHVFDWQGDVHEDWENSFYLSLDRVDGMLILNGAKSTLIAGLFGITQSKPIVALPAQKGALRRSGHCSKNRIC